MKLKDVVLTVDREELEPLLSDLMRHGFKCGKGTATPSNHVTVTLDLILAKLAEGGLREAREIISDVNRVGLVHRRNATTLMSILLDGNPNKPHEVAVLKPLPQAKEEER